MVDGKLLVVTVPDSVVVTVKSLPLVLALGTPLGTPLNELDLCWAARPAPSPAPMATATHTTMIPTRTQITLERPGIFA